jgi:uncharacterized protein (TIGR03435 family)
MRKFAGFLVAAGLYAQSPSFEVASIKPAGPINPARIAAGQMKIGMSIDSARVDIGFFSIADLIRTAYRIKSHEVAGPDWLSMERFNIQAKIPDGVSKDLVPEMLQALLAERFKLTSHRETKEIPVYSLIVGKNGHKMKDAEPDTPAAAGEPAPSNQLKIDGNPQGGRGVTVTAGGRGGINMKVGENGQMQMAFEKMPMAGLAEMLTRFVDRPVVDQTNLAGNYQFALSLSMEELRGMAVKAGALMAMGGGAGAPGGPVRIAPEGDSSGGSIFTAVSDLGLKLESRKLPVQVLVVDHAEKAPTEN